MSGGILAGPQATSVRLNDRRGYRARIGVPLVLEPARFKQEGHLPITGARDAFLLFLKMVRRQPVKLLADLARHALQITAERELLRIPPGLGREVRVSLPGGKTVTGLASDVDHTGRLMVRSASELVGVSAGDVIHVR